jgi:hypothetical protein
MKIVLQTSMDRAKVFANNLGRFGIPLMELLTPKLPVKVNFQGQIFEMGSATLKDDFDPFEHGFSSPRIWAEGCLGWIWCQWLSSAPREKIQKEVEFVVERGMEMQKKSANQHYRCLHDLWLLNCAALASSTNQLERLANVVVDSKGDKQEPRNNGELFAAAWCGALKYWILGEQKKAAEEFKIAGEAYRYDIARVAPKPLVAKWLAGDWKGFAKEQKKDFKARWERARKDRIVISENADEVVIAFDNIPVPGRGWCWAHCGMAMLAHRQGIEVVTDPFWFPPHALDCVELSNPRVDSRHTGFQSGMRSARPFPPGL